MLLSLIGQMSCVHYKGGTLVRWEGVSPGIRSVGRQSTRPQGGLSGWLTGMMERMCHAEHVCALKSHSSRQPAFRHKHAQRDSGSAGLCALNFSEVLSKLTFTRFDWCNRSHPFLHLLAVQAGISYQRETVPCLGTVLFYFLSLPQCSAEVWKLLTKDSMCYC